MSTKARLSVLAATLLAVGSVSAQEATPTPAPAPPKLWSNETELSVVLTEGNSNTQTLGFKNLLTRRTAQNRFRLKVEGLRAATSDDWFEQVDPGFTWDPGATPTGLTSSLVKPPSELDAENYFVEGRNDRTISKKFNWHAGASWDRNEDAGIVNRYIGFGGLGHLWYDREDLKFQSSYGLSYTDREEETPDPEKDERFAGMRLSWLYLNKFGDNTTYNNDWTFNVSLADQNDWSSEMTNALSVAMGKWLSLRVSLRWLYNHEPALEDVDVVARVEVRDPDGIPGNGDEFFETVSGGGAEITFGETQVRKEKLDQTFKTTLVVSF
jgi:hypothetical protein